MFLAGLPTPIFHPLLQNVCSNSCYRTPFFRLSATYSLIFTKKTRIPKTITTITLALTFIRQHRVSIPSAGVWKHQAPFTFGSIRPLRILSTMRALPGFLLPDHRGAHGDSPLILAPLGALNGKPPPQNDASRSGGGSTSQKNPPILVQSGETIQTSPVYYTVGTCVWIDSGNWVIRSRKRPTDSTLESGKPVPSS